MPVTFDQFIDFEYNHEQGEWKLYGFLTAITIVFLILTFTVHIGFSLAFAVSASLILVLFIQQIEKLERVLKIKQ